MKSVSLWEPWASLIRTGAKTFETRHWSTDYRGQLLICAAKTGLPKREIYSYLAMGKFQQGLLPLLGGMAHERIGKRVQFHHLNFGKAVAIVTLTACIPTVKIPVEQIEGEYSFGNYAPDRFGWKLENLFTDFEPFTVVGQQGFFDVPESLLREKAPNYFEIVR